jgi:N-acyl-D-amino-acid deacylase
MLIELISRLDDCDRSLARECNGSIVATSMDEPDIRKLMNWRHTSICSDGASVGRHPRGFGAFPRVLGQYVRTEKSLEWEAAVNKMTGLPASNLGIQRRGMIQPGFFADMVIFDDDLVKDESTIAEPQKIASGIRKVFVNGVEVFDAGHTTGKYPGRVILRESTPTVMMASGK